MAPGGRQTALQEARLSAALSARREDRRQFRRRHDLELRIRAIARPFVRSPPPEMRHVTETRSLHVLVRHLGHQFRTQRLPRKVLALAPPALAAGHAMAR